MYWAAEPAAVQWRPAGMRRNMKRSLFLMTMMLLVTVGATAQRLKVTTVEGGFARTRMGNSGEINERSTLRRTYLNIDDPGCPIQLSRVGVFTTFTDGEFNYRTTGTILPGEPIVAFDLTMILFDDFGDHLDTLGLVRVADINSGETYDLSPRGSWLTSEGEVTRLLTVVAFVSRVRTAGGKVWRSNDKAVIEELQRVPLQITSDILVPRSEFR